MVGVPKASDWDLQTLNVRLPPWASLKSNVRPDEDFVSYPKPRIH